LEGGTPLQQQKQRIWVLSQNNTGTGFSQAGLFVARVPVDL